MSARKLFNLVNHFAVLRFPRDRPVNNLVMVISRLIATMDLFHEEKS